MTIQRRFTGFFLVLCISLLFFFSACGKKEEAIEETPSASASAMPTVHTITLAPAASASPSATPEFVPSATVSQVTAYYFSDINNIPSLYAAFEVENTSNVPITLGETTVTFNTGKYNMADTYTPMQSADDIIMPHQKNTYACWLVYDKEPKLTIDSPITATVEVTPLVAEEERTSRALQIDHVRLIQNYPTFPTVSGSIVNPPDQRDFSLSLIYVSMYNENDELLAVWHFTKDMTIPSGSRRNFVMHVRSLPIPSLAEQTHRVEARGIGFE